MTFNSNDQVDVLRLWKELLRKKWYIVGVGVLFACCSVWYSLSLPNTYRAEVLLSAAEDSSSQGLASLAGQLGGLASIAGLNMGSVPTEKSELALEILQSKRFINDFVEANNLKPMLFAAKQWDPQSRQVTIDATIYDETNQKWLRTVEAPLTQEPSEWEVYDAFSRLLTIEEKKGVSLFSIAIEHISPDLAADWVEKLVLAINEDVRAGDKKEALRSIKFLEQQLNQTSLAGMQTVLYQLIEEQTKTAMLTSIRKEYVFRTVDPAIVPQFKYAPKRALICLLGTALGVALSTFIVLLVTLVRPQKAE